MRELKPTNPKQRKKLLKKMKNAKKRSKKCIPNLKDVDAHLQPWYIRKKDKKVKPEKWFAPLAPCDSWCKSSSRVKVPLPKRKRPLRRDGAEYVSYSVDKPQGRFQYYKLGFYLEENYLSYKMVTHLKPAFSKACRYFRPYLKDRRFAFAIKCCVHFGFTTKRIRSLLRIGDLYRRGNSHDYLISIKRWIVMNFSANQRYKVLMDADEELLNDIPNPNIYTESEDSDYSSGGYDPYF